MVFNKTNSKSENYYNNQIGNVFKSMAFFATLLIIFCIPLNALAVTSQEINNLKNQVKTLTNQRYTLQNQLDSFDQQIQAIQSQINETNSKINAINIKINTTNNQIKTAENDLIKQREIMNEYLKTMYIDGQASTLELIASSENFSDFVDKSEYMNTMQQKVQETAEKIVALKLELQSKKKDLEIEKSKVEQIRIQQVSLRTGLANQRAERESIMAKTKGQESAYRALLSQKQAEFARQAIAGGGNSTYTSTGRYKIFDFPTRGGNISQGYGMTDYARDGAYKGAIHNGIDIARISYGAPIYAIGPGTVLAKATYPSAWGYWLIVAQDNGYYSLYGHFLAPAYVNVGERVGSTTIVGGAGSTGFSTDVHLHFSLYSSNPGYSSSGPSSYGPGSVDPLDFFKSINASFSGTDWDPKYKH